jgi:hypothetical protein
MRCNKSIRIGACGTVSCQIVPIDPAAPYAAPRILVVIRAMPDLR